MIYLITSFISKLHVQLVAVEPMITPSIMFLQGEEMPFEVECILITFCGKIIPMHHGIVYTPQIDRNTNFSSHLSHFKLHKDKIISESSDSNCTFP